LTLFSLYIIANTVWLLANDVSVDGFDCSLLLNVVRMFPWLSGVKFHLELVCHSGQCQPAPANRWFCALVELCWSRSHLTSLKLTQHSLRSIMKYVLCF